jgi:glucose-6-phosphate isomerase
MHSQTFQQLKDHQSQFTFQLKDLFANDPERFNKFHLVFQDILVDFSKNLIVPETLTLLLQLVEEAGLSKMRKDLFAGEKINLTEGRPVLHTCVFNFSIIIDLFSGHLEIVPILQY